MENNINTIVIIGSGNMAYHLARAFTGAGVQLVQILARNRETAGKLSEQFNVPYTLTPGSLFRTADLYILAINDDSIEEAAGNLRLADQLLVHTSGSAPMKIISRSSSSTGVIYPLQTLTAGHNIDFSQVPICIEANSEINLRKLSGLAARISGRVVVMDSEKRLYTHLAAVFASNFTNHMYDVAASILKKQHLSFELLLPLIKETAAKAEAQGPEKAQTGPAVRADVKVIEQHLRLLAAEKNWQDIYQLLTDNIMKKLK